MRDVRALLVALGVLLGLSGEPTLSQERGRAAVRSDLVLVVDVSASMDTGRAMDRAKTLLNDILGKVVHPGTQVALISFGTGVSEPRVFNVPFDPYKAADTRSQIRAALNGLKAKDMDTHLHEAIDRGLGVLRAFKKRRPDRTRRMILISDGFDDPKKGAPNLTIEEVVKRNDTAGFRKAKDWFIWYGHFGEANDSVKKALQRTGAGTVLPLDELRSLKWVMTRVEPESIDLGPVAAGHSRRTIRLVAITDENGEGEVVNVNVAGSDSVRISRVRPKYVQLKGRKTTFDLEIDVDAARLGKAAVHLEFRAEPGVLHWVETKRIPIHMKVMEPKVKVSPARIRIEHLAPGAKIDRQIRFRPSALAKRRSEFRVDPHKVPAGHSLVPETSSLAVAGKRSLRFSVRVPRDAKAGAYESRIRIATIRGFKPDHEEVVVEYRVAFGEVTAEKGAAVFPPVSPGGKVHGILRLRAQESAVGAPIFLKLTETPPGLQFTVPKKILLTGETTEVPILVRALEGTPPGPQAARLRLRGPDGIHVRNGEVRLACEVLDIADLGVPPTLDLGDVWATAAGSVSGVLRFEAPTLPEGWTLELKTTGKENRVKMETVGSAGGTLLVPFSLRTRDRKPGSHAERVRVFVQKGRHRVQVGTTAVSWHVMESRMSVHGIELPEVVPTGASEHRLKLELGNTPDLKGREIRFTADIPDLPEEMGVSVEAKPTRLEDGRVTHTLKLRVTEAAVGTFSGRVLISCGDDVPEAQAELRIVVSAARILAALVGDTVELGPGETRTLVLKLRGASLEGPSMVAVRVGNAPHGVQAEAAALVEVSEGETEVPLRFSVTDAAEAGDWRARIRLRSLSSGVRVTPAELSVTGRISGFWERHGTHVLWGGLILACALIALALFRLRPRRQVVHIPVEMPRPEPKTGPPIIDDDELLIIGDIEDEA